MFSKVLEIMTIFENYNNFTGLVAFYSALNCSSVFRLKETKEVIFLFLNTFSVKIDHFSIPPCTV